MTRQVLAFMTAAVLGAGLAGCASLSTVRAAAPDAGRSMVFKRPIAEVYPAVQETVSWLDLNIAEKNDQEHTILASKGMSALSWGERVRIVCKPLSASETQVTILSKRVVATNVFATDWADKLFERLTVTLGDNSL